jgi:hypothetical protein
MKKVGSGCGDIKIYFHYLTPVPVLPSPPPQNEKKTKEK